MTHMRPFAYKHTHKMLLVIFSQESPLAWDTPQGIVYLNDRIILIYTMQFNAIAGPGKAILIYSTFHTQSIA